MLITEDAPTPLTPLGAKGAGEGGTAAAGAAIANAVSDAFGVEVKGLPLTPARVLELARRRGRRRWETHEERLGMKIVDLTHRFSIHTPGWVGYPSPKLSYFQRHATNGIVSQWLELPLHSGTHFDGQMHIVSGGADIASVADRPAVPRGRDRRHLR